jgi:hypothetical protein
LSTKLEKVLPGSEWHWGRERGRGRGQGREMAQTMYAHVNKKTFSIKKERHQQISMFF